MFYQLRMKLNYLKLNWQLRGIKNTPPVRIGGNNDLMLLSLLNNRDVFLYLVAVKSFCQYVVPARVMIVKDPTLTVEDQALLSVHVPGIEFCEMNDFSGRGLPSGNCWERLAAISHFNKDHYVVQLDSDTITTHNPKEVERCIQSGVSFILGTKDNQSPEKYEVAASRAREYIERTDDLSPQGCSEAALVEVDLFANRRYIRGCAGFAGFAKGLISPADINDLSLRFSQAVGDIWHVWGSEQFASNLLLSGSEKTEVLPHPKYSTPDRYFKGISFVHFIGPLRFKKGLYSKLGKNLITSLKL